MEGRRVLKNKYSPGLEVKEFIRMKRQSELKDQLRPMHSLLLRPSQIAIRQRNSEQLRSRLRFQLITERKGLPRQESRSQLRQELRSQLNPKTPDVLKQNQRSPRNLRLPPSTKRRSPRFRSNHKVSLHLLPSQTRYQRHHPRRPKRKRQR